NHEPQRPSKNDSARPRPDDDRRRCTRQHGRTAWLACGATNTAAPCAEAARHRILESNARPDRDVLTVIASPALYFRGPSSLDGPRPTALASGLNRRVSL